MEEEKKPEVSLKTANQEIYILKVLKSKKILDKEYQELKKIYEEQVVTSRDASIFLKYLFALTDFRRTFLNGKHKAYKKCFYCGSRENVERFHDQENERLLWLCETCGLNTAHGKISRDKNKFLVRDSRGDNIIRTYQKDSGYKPVREKEVDSDFLYEQHRDRILEEETELKHKGK